MKSYTLAIISFCAVLAVVYAETDCESHKRNAGRGAHTLEWDIQCDSEGKYMPLQCTKDEKPEKKWCTCYNEDNAVTGPSRKMRHCNCPIERAENEANENSADKNCYAPQCDNTGKYEPKQCCPAKGKCRCVDRTSGEQTVAPTSDTNLQCS